MLEFTSDGQPVYLTPGTNMQLELNSPLFDEDTIKGSFSYSMSVPAGPNGPLYGFPERPDGPLQPGTQLPAELALEGLPLLTGTQRVKSATPAKYSVSMQAGLSGANLSERQLSSFDYGGVRLFPRRVPDGLDGGGNPKFRPGLLDHMNDVVANPQNFDYVFAPLRNDFIPDGQPTPADPLDFPPASVNLWVNGAFRYTVPQVVIGLPPAVGGGDLPLFCPFPRLRYVLQALLQESGLAVDLPNLLPGVLGDLFFVTNAALIDRGDWEHVGFSLADVVPGLTVAELLAAIRQDLGVVVYLDTATQLARTAYLVERVAADADYTDLTHCLAGYPEATLDVDKGLTLTYHVDSEDELTKDLLDKQPDPTLILPAVATVADLPVIVLNADNPQSGQLRLVLATGTYFECFATYRDPTSVTLTWTEQPELLPRIDVNGGGDEQAQVLCYTTTRRTRLDYITGAPEVDCIAISQPFYRADQATPTRSTALRLLFYNGLQLTSDGVSTYPQLAMQNAAGTHSLKLSGPIGTYTQWLAAWLPTKLRGTSYKQALLLTPLDLARLDLSRQLWLDGVPYLVRKLSVTVPLKKAATVELVRL